MLHSVMRRGGGAQLQQPAREFSNFSEGRDEGKADRRAGNTSGPEVLRHKLCERMEGAGGVGGLGNAKRALVFQSLQVKNMYMHTYMHT